MSQWRSIGFQLKLEQKKIKHVNECDGTSVNGKYVARAESIKWITIQKENWNIQHNASWENVQC